MRLLAIPLLFQILILAQGSSTVSAADPERNEKIKELLKERLAIVSKIRERVDAGYKNGQVQLERVLEAGEQLLNAKLDLAETKEDRMKIHDELVKLAEELKRYVEGAVKAGRTGEMDLLKAKVHVLNARIAREKARAAK